jgi:hypothetical protein
MEEIEKDLENVLISRQLSQILFPDPISGEILNLVTPRDFDEEPQFMYRYMTPEEHKSYSQRHFSRVQPIVEDSEIEVNPQLIKADPQLLSSDSNGRTIVNNRGEFDKYKLTYCKLRKQYQDQINELHSLNARALKEFTSIFDSVSISIMQPFMDQRDYAGALQAWKSHIRQSENSGDTTSIEDQIDWFAYADNRQAQDIRVKIQDFNSIMLSATRNGCEYPYRLHYSRAYRVFVDSSPNEFMQKKTIKVFDDCSKKSWEFQCRLYDAYELTRPEFNQLLPKQVSDHSSDTGSTMHDDEQRSVISKKSISPNSTFEINLDDLLLPRKERETLLMQQLGGYYFKTLYPSICTELIRIYSDSSARNELNVNKLRKTYLSKIVTKLQNLIPNAKGGGKGDKK